MILKSFSVCKQHPLASGHCCLPTGFDFRQYSIDSISNCTALIKLSTSI